MTNKTRSKRRKYNNKTKKKTSISHSIFNTPKTIYKNSDFNTIKFPQIPIIKYSAMKMVDNMCKVSTIKNTRIKRYVKKEYIRRLKLLLKKNPRFKKKITFNLKNIDKISPTLLETSYFKLLALE
tara:strand:+ start:2875 stop:3249 length:375 start_codon:yes stop_codon:yes gene_type:complete